MRLPEDLNDWLDDYARLHRKQGVKKQDLISRAVQLLIFELNGSSLPATKDERAHSPNEFFRLRDFERGSRIYAQAFQRIATIDVPS